MAATLITVTQALAHLRVPATDPDLELKMAQAEAAILRYCARTAYWQAQIVNWIDPDTVPPDVQAAIMLQLGELFRFRGDDLAGEGPNRSNGEDLAPAIVGLLRRWSDPVLQ